MDRRSIKKQAISIVKENFKDIWIGLSVNFIITIIFNILFGYVLNGSNINTYLYNGIPVAFNFLTIPLSFGTSKYLLAVIRNEKHSFSDLFYYYKNRLIETLILSIVISLCTTLGMVAFIIPAIVIYMMFAQAENIFIDSNLNSFDSLKQSINLMKGYKWDYFNFLISFLGWVLLGIVTFGLLYIWVYPYLMISQKLYYVELTKIKNLQ